MSTEQRYRFVSTISAEPNQRTRGLMTVRFYDAQGNHVHSDYWTDDQFAGSFEVIADTTPDHDEQETT